MSEMAPSIGFEVWYEDAWPDLTRSLTFAFRGNQDLAADAAAEACTKAYARWEDIGASTNPTGWAYTVGLRAGRRLARRSVLDRRLRGRLSMQPSGAGTANTSWCELADVVGDLPSRQRDVVVLRYVLQMEQHEIADVLGVAPGTVAASLNRARSRLKPALDPDGKLGSPANHEETTRAS